MFTDFSLTGKKWLLPNGSTQNAGNIVSILLNNRGLTLPSMPPVFPEIQKAKDRIFTAIDNKETVAIFGDYDCDGITSTAQLVRFFRRRGIEPIARLPHRIRDGYGLSNSIVEEFKDKEVSLLITVDNGIASAKEIALAKKYGMDTIVTDHHAVGEHIPKAAAILHPELADCPKPHPAGAGVVFLLLSALEDGTWEDKPTDLALAMLGTVADLVELRGYNRQLVQDGLSALQKIQSGPLALLRESTGARTSTDIAFRIAPRINAAGRIAEPDLALEALLSGGQALAELDELNMRRQTEMHDLYREVTKSLDTNTPLLFAAESTYPHGLLGLIAGRLTEATGKPSCIVNVRDGECTASLRSPACYHITEGLTRCQDFLSRFGGHACAAGCSFPRKNLEQFRAQLSADIAEHTNEQDLMPSIQIDAVLSTENITLEFCKALETLEPYGSGNPEPRFLLEGIRIENARAVGSDKTHLQCSIAGKKSIGFGLAPFEQEFSNTLDAVCRLQIDRWNGSQQPQLVIEDLRITKRTPQRPQVVS